MLQTLELGNPDRVEIIDILEDAYELLLCHINEIL